MCKKGWCVVDQGRTELRQCGGTVSNTLKVGGTEKREGEATILKKKGQAGSRDGCLKKRGELEPTYETMMFTSTLQQENNRLSRFWLMFPFGTP